MAIDHPRTRPGLDPDVVLRLAGATVLVVGDVMLDRYLSGAVERISPEAPVPVVLSAESHAVLGGAANVAANVGALGARVELAGLYGDDTDGDDLEQLCAEAGVQLTAGLRRTGHRTTVKQRVVAGGQQLLRIDTERYQPADGETLAAVLGRLTALAEQGTLGAVIVSDYAKGTVTADLARAVIEVARRHHVPVVVDPKGVDLERYAGATVLKPNLTEARKMCAADLDRPELASVDALARVLFAKVDVDSLVISLAADGVALCGRDKPTQHFSSIALEVADVSGAGDTMVAVLATALAAGLDRAEAVELGNIAAGVACRHFGTAVITADELSAEIARISLPAESPHIVSDWDRLARLLDLRRRAGARVVFANGCFDLLHSGHVALLEQARRLGDVLVVGLNSDDSTRRLKGPTRPLQKEQDRLRVMAAVRFVDYVSVFEQDTPLELILAIRPDVIVKGGDYRPEDVVGGTEAASWGGRVHIVALLDGLSTTALAGGR